MKLLITGAWDGAGEYISKIEEMGHRVFFQQMEKDPLVCPPEEIEGIIGNGIFLYHPIEEFRNLRYIQLTSAGYDRVPTEYVRAHGIRMNNARGVYSIPMAEFALGGVLQIYKQSGFFYENKKKHVWNKHRGLLELFGKKVTIAGCGSVGTECARRFKAFGCSVTGVDLFPREDDSYDSMVSLSMLDQVLKDTEVLVLTMPLTKETRHLMDEDRLSLLPGNAVIVNIARGPVIRHEALVSCLEQRKVLGAVLDVFEQEPLPEDSPLWDMENVILTPHNSFIGENNKDRLGAVIMKNLEKARK
jgi:phosphoglycerate dehydrogenase-like enzyme